ncbi:hypothetical protein [Micromonospora sp. I033]
MSRPARHEEVLHALLRSLVASADVDQLCDGADLPQLTHDGTSVTATCARVSRDAGVLTLDRGVRL